eukprot:9799-Eustigmatos_ZCMA.PRE.1
MQDVVRLDEELEFQVLSETNDDGPILLSLKRIQYEKYVSRQRRTILRHATNVDLGSAAEDAGHGLGFPRHSNG